MTLTLFVSVLVASVACAQIYSPCPISAGQTDSSLCQQNLNQNRNQCYTPNGQLGSCISIYSCPHLVNLLKPPLSPEILAFVRNHRCEGAEQNSVCCGPTMEPGPVAQPEECILTAAPPDPRTECCGRESSSDRITGGEEAKIDQYPWMALIEYKKGRKTLLMCGGSLISGKYVLTAGHCVIGSVLKFGTPTNVRLGEHDSSHDGPDCVTVDGEGEDCNEGTTVIPIERIIPHQDYDPYNSLKRNDIALLRLAQTAPYTDYIRPICLPSKDVTQKPLPTLNFTAAGWGATEDAVKSNVKLFVQLPYKSLEECQPAYSVIGRSVPLWEAQLCAGGEEGHDTCKGDSGGPLMYYRDDITWELTGVVNFGSLKCGSVGVPGVYAKVYHYLPWIRSQIKP